MNFFSPFLFFLINLNLIFCANLKEVYVDQSSQSESLFEEIDLEGPSSHNLIKVTNFNRAAAFFGHLVYESLNPVNSKKINYEVLKLMIDRIKSENEYFEIFVAKSLVQVIFEKKSLEEYLFQDEITEDEDLYLLIIRDTFHLYRMLGPENAVMDNPKVFINTLSLSVITDLIPLIGDDLILLLDHLGENNGAEFTEQAKLFGIFSQFDPFYQHSLDKDKIIKYLVPKEERESLKKKLENLSVPGYHTEITNRKLITQAEFNSESVEKRIPYLAGQKPVSSYTSTRCMVCPPSRKVIYHYHPKNSSKEYRQMASQRVENLERLFHKDPQLSKYLMIKYDVGLAKIKSIDQTGRDYLKLIGSAFCLIVIVGLIVAFCSK
jgi:hypothetical protein